MRPSTVPAWLLGLLVPLLMAQPSLVGLIAAPSFMGQQWDDDNGMWWGLMNASLALAYLLWMARWAAASHISWVPRLVAILLLTPGLFFAAYCVIYALAEIGTRAEGPNFLSNEAERAGVFVPAAIAISAAALLLGLDRRRGKRRQPPAAPAT